MEIWVDIFGQHREKKYSTGVTIKYGNTSLCTCLCHPTVIIFDSCTCLSRTHFLKLMTSVLKVLAIANAV